MITIVCPKLIDVSDLFKENKDSMLLTFMIIEPFQAFSIESLFSVQLKFLYGIQDYRIFYSHADDSLFHFGFIELPSELYIDGNKLSRIVTIYPEKMLLNTPYKKAIELATYPYRSKRTNKDFGL